MGHVLEHVALELQNLAGAEVARGKTRGDGRARRLQRRLRVRAGRRRARRRASSAVRLLNHLIYDTEPDFDFVQRAGRERHPGRRAPGLRPLDRRDRLRGGAARHPRAAPRSAPLARPARPRRVPEARLGDGHLSDTSNIAVDIAGNKELTNRLLHEVGIPVPRGVRRPQRRRSGRGGAPDRLPGRAQAARRQPRPRRLHQSRRRGRGARVLPGRRAREPRRHGRRRDASSPARTTASWSSTTRSSRSPSGCRPTSSATASTPSRELIEITNADPRRGVGHEKILTRISVDAQTHGDP